jgi:hypothetical protein
MSYEPPMIDADNYFDEAKAYDWEMVISCGVALLLQSQWDGEPIADMLARAKASPDDERAMGELWAYVRRTLQPMK